MEFNLKEIKDLIYNDDTMTLEEKNSVFEGSLISMISNLKFALSESDWKVVVNSELVQIGLDIKYPNLHTERQA